jgi:hypothetical protein
MNEKRWFIEFQQYNVACLKCSHPVIASGSLVYYFVPHAMLRTTLIPLLFNHSKFALKVQAVRIANEVT